MATETNPLYERMRIYTVYLKPLDYPSAWVLRGYTVTKDGAVPDDHPSAVLLARGEPERELETIREEIPRGMTLIPRHDEDDPTIVESWI